MRPRLAALVCALLSASLAAGGCVSKGPAGAAAPGPETGEDGSGSLAPVWVANLTYARRDDWRLIVAAPVPIDRVAPHVPEPLEVQENADTFLGPPTPLTPVTRDLLAPRTLLVLEVQSGEAGSSRGSGVGLSLRAWVVVDAPEPIPRPDGLPLYLLGAWTTVPAEAELLRLFLFNTTREATASAALTGPQLEAAFTVDEGEVARIRAFAGPGPYAVEAGTHRFANPYWDVTYFLDEERTRFAGMQAHAVVQAGPGSLLEDLIGPVEAPLFSGGLFTGGSSRGTFGFLVNPDGPLAGQTDWGAATRSR